VTRALDAAERAMQLARWPEALAAVNQAEARLDPGGGAALRLRCRRMKQDLAMVSRLDEIRQEMSAVKDDHFDMGLGDRLYGEAFRDYGIDVETLSPDVVAGKMPAGPVREELIGALDDWMRIRREMHKKDESDWKRLLAAARAADADPWRNRVREAWLKGDRQALVELAGAAAFDRLHPSDVLLLQANLDNDRAVAVLREAQRRRPGDFWLNHTLGMRLHAMRPPRFEEAIGYLRTAAALRPESPGAIFNVGHVLQEADKTDEAIAADEQAIRLKPDYVMAYSNLGSALCDAGRYDEAIRACREAIRLNPDYHEAHTNLGRALLKTGELDAAIAALREALRVEPGCRLAARHLAEACFTKVVTGPQLIHRWIDRHIVRLSSPRPFLQYLFDPRSLPMLRRHFVLKLLAASVLASPALAQKPPRYVFTSFDPPGSSYTQAYGLNHGGTIVGYFSNATSSFNGYVYSGGIFTQFDVPGAQKTFLNGINDSGTIVGNYLDALGDSHGLVLSNGNFTTVDVPGATSTSIKGINFAGDMVGWYNDAAGTDHGFLLSAGVFTTIDYPSTTYTVCFGINQNGEVVGDYKDAGGNLHGFALTGGKFTSISYPNANFTQVLGINGAGQVVGRYQLSDGVNHGFVLSNGTYTAINYANATSTMVCGINDLGEIVGQWQDRSGKNHGFYAVKH
jgi:tetratricopeptide (TPR) repeat protein